uniref:AIG1-type G domain-containing protein n=1 Tax=Oryzias latipes TaxID=8090 RepID=A0A3P9L6L6_ORYLA
TQSYTDGCSAPGYVPKSLRIVLLGKAGTGKSSLANTIFGTTVFTVNHFDSSVCVSESQTRQVNGRSLTLIDTPGLMTPDRSEEDINREMVRCITECAPGPHAFLIVFKVEKFTEQEQAVFKEICQHFSEEALKYTAVMFTHGDQLPEDMTIQDFVSMNSELRDLVEKCGGRCHVVDNKYWKQGRGHYRSNQFQVAELLRTIDRITEANNGRWYTNETLQEAERQIAKNIAYDKLLTRFVGVATGAVLGFLLGVFSTVEPSNLTAISKNESMSPALAAAKQGAQVGWDAAEKAQSLSEAFYKTTDAFWKNSLNPFSKK